MSEESFSRIELEIDRLKTDFGKVSGSLDSLRDVISDLKTSIAVLISEDTSNRKALEHLERSVESSHLDVEKRQEDLSQRIKVLEQWQHGLMGKLVVYNALLMTAVGIVSGILINYFTP